MNKELEKEIIDALEEAEYLEFGVDNASTDHMLETASKLAGVSMIDVLAVYKKYETYKYE